MTQILNHAPPANGWGLNRKELSAAKPQPNFRPQITQIVADEFNGVAFVSAGPGVFRFPIKNSGRALD